MFNSPITFDRFARIILITALIAGVFSLIYRLESVLLPFCIATLFAYFLHPLVLVFEKYLRVRSRFASVLLTMLLAAGVLFGVYLLVVPPLFDEVQKVNNLLANYIADNHTTTSVPEAIHQFINKNIDLPMLQTALKRTLTEENIITASRTILPQIRVVIDQSIAFIGIAITLCIVLMYIFFILLDYESLTRGWIPYIPNQYREQTRQIMNNIRRSMKRYFRGQALIALIVGVLSTIGFLIIGLPMAIAMGLLVAVLTLVPYMKVLALIPTLLLTLLKAVDTGLNFWWLTLLLFIVFAVVQIIEDMILVPKIMGHITGLHPAIILLSLSVWGSLLGVIGVIIAIPLTSLLLYYIKQKDNPKAAAQ